MVFQAPAACKYVFLTINATVVFFLILKVVGEEDVLGETLAALRSLSKAGFAAGLPHTAVVLPGTLSRKIPFWFLKRSLGLECVSE